MSKNLFQKKIILIVIFFIYTCQGFTCIGGIDRGEDINYPGEFYACDGKYDLALVEFEKVLALYPNNIEGLNNHGKTLFFLTRFDEALESFEKIKNIKSIAATDSASAEAHLNRGITLFYLSRFNEAIEALKKSNEIQTIGSTSILWIYLATEKLDMNGRLILDNWIKKHNLENTNFKPVPVAFVYQGKWKPNELIREKAAKQYLDEVYFHLGQFYLLQGNRLKAEEMFNKVVNKNTCFSIEQAAAKEELRRLS